MENCWWEQELQLYNQYEEERIPNLENVLMQIMETSEATQHAIQNLEIQVGKLAKEVAKLPFLVTREENFVEVEAHEESLVEEHDSRGKDEKNEERTQQQWEKCSQVFLGYKSFMESIANRRKCKEEVFYVTFMPP
ncbi:hypothetical protein JHK85_000529 [Glycine max]|nr:hypothetical protein JHK85_000529 [Glycine max]